MNQQQIFDFNQNTTDAATEHSLSIFCNLIWWYYHLFQACVHRFDITSESVMIYTDETSWNNVCMSCYVCNHHWTHRPKNREKTETPLQHPIYLTKIVCFRMSWRRPLQHVWVWGWCLPGNHSWIKQRKKRKWRYIRHKFIQPLKSYYYRLKTITLLPQFMVHFHLSGNLEPGDWRNNSQLTSKR